MSEVKVYNLRSSGLIHTPGMIRYWMSGYPVDPRRMYWQMAMAFPALPAALIADVLSCRCPFTVEGAELDTVVIKWTEPLGEFEDYLRK
jgi:hypothetical protein